MTKNDEIILNQILEQERKRKAHDKSQALFFDMFTCEQILKDFDLSDDEIESGIVDGGGDGGIDGFYTFVNGDLVQEDSDFTDLRKNINIELFLIQAKTSNTFSEVVMDRFASTIKDLFDFSKNLGKLRSTYNKPVVSAARRFREQYQGLASRFPELRIVCVYATKGADVHPSVERKTVGISEIIKSLFSCSEFSFVFLGASQLLDLARKTPKISNELKLAENPISSYRNGFLCLVPLTEFYNFIVDENGHLRRRIFEANVRDYQGDIQVNEEIQATLQSAGREEFWWLNNGVTIVASKCSLNSGKTLSIETPEIVNGLQTSREIYNYFRDGKTKNERRNILIRVIVPSAGESRERIIKAKTIRQQFLRHNSVLLIEFIVILKIISNHLAYIMIGERIITKMREGKKETLSLSLN